MAAAAWLACAACVALLASAAGYTVDCNRDYTDCERELRKLDAQETSTLITEELTTPKNTKTTNAESTKDAAPVIAASVQPQPRLLNLSLDDLQTFANTLHNQTEVEGRSKDLSDVTIDDDDEETVPKPASKPKDIVKNKFFDNLQAPFNAAGSGDVKSACRDGRETYKVGERSARGCEETCECMPTGSFECSPRCQHPYVRRGRALDDPLCFESPVDECCSIVACASGNGGDVCQLGNETHAVGSSWNIGCQKVCRCEPHGVVMCKPRCPALPQSDKCINVADPGDACCEMQVCDVSHDAHEEPENGTTTAALETAATTTVNVETAAVTTTPSFFPTPVPVAPPKDVERSETVTPKVPVKPMRPLVLAEPIGSVKVLQNNTVQVNLMHPNNTKDPIHLLLSNDAGKTYRDIELVYSNLIINLEAGKDYVLKTKETGTNFNFTITATDTNHPDVNEVPDEIIDTSKEGCEHDGKLYAVGEEFHIGCSELCECVGPGRRECAALECPNHVGLELVSRGCVQWAPSPPLEPPNCCPRSARCLSDGTCHYKGHDIPNWSEVPLEYTGCEQRCFCENGELDCQEVCSPVPALPPRSLRCPPGHRAAPVNISDDDCCKEWGCVPDARMWSRRLNKPPFYQDNTLNDDNYSQEMFIKPSSTTITPSIKTEEYSLETTETSTIKTIIELLDMPTHRDYATEYPTLPHAHSKDQIRLTQTTPPPNIYKLIMDSGPYQHSLDLVPTRPNFPHYDGQSDFTPDNTAQPLKNPQLPSAFSVDETFDLFPNNDVAKLKAKEFLQQNPGKYYNVKNNYDQDVSKPLTQLKARYNSYQNNPYYPIQMAKIYKNSNSLSSSNKSSYLTPRVVPKLFNELYFMPLKMQLFKRTDSPQTGLDLNTSDVIKTIESTTTENFRIQLWAAEEKFVKQNRSHGRNKNLQRSADDKDDLSADAVGPNFLPTKPPIHKPSFLPTVPPSGEPDEDYDHNNLHHPMSAPDVPTLPQLPGLPAAPPLYDEDNKKLTVISIQADSPTSVKMLFGLPPVLVGLRGSVDLRYTDLPTDDVSQWFSQVFAPADEVLGTPRLEFRLTGLKPSTVYRIKGRLYLHNINVAPESAVYSVKTLDLPVVPTPEEKRREVDTQLAAADGNDTAALVTWRRFTDHELVFIDGIQVRYRPVGTPIYLMTELLHHSRTSAALADLRPDTRYEASLVLVPPPRALTELYDPRGVLFTTQPYVDPYNWSVTLTGAATGAGAARLAWRGVPAPAERWVRVYRAAHACGSARRETDAFRLAARDEPMAITVTGLASDSRCRVWLELFLTNGKVKTSNVLEINTKPEDQPEDIDNMIEASAVGGGPRGDYYGALVGVGVVAALGAVTSLLLLLIVVRRHRPRSVPITTVPSAPREGSLPPYDNPAYKIELQQETMDL